MKRILLGLVVVLSLSLVLFAHPAFADNVRISPNNITDRGGIDPGAKSDSVVATILGGVYQISAIVAVLVLVIAGIRYITSDGDPSRAQSARKGIIYSLIGLVIIGSAFIITGVVIGLFS